MCSDTKTDPDKEKLLKFQIETGYFITTEYDTDDVVLLISFLFVQEK